MKEVCESKCALFFKLTCFTGGYGERLGTVFAVPAVAEKGYLDTRITVSP